MNFAVAMRSAITRVIDRHPSFARVTPRILVHTPIEHCAKYLVLRTSGSSGYFVVEWWINFLCEPKTHRCLYLGRINGSLGRSEKFKRKGENGLFEVADATMPEDFVDQVGDLILPFFTSLNTFEKAVEFASKDHPLFLGSREAWKALVTIAMGDISTAKAIWKSRDTENSQWKVPGMYKDNPEFSEWCRLEEPLMAGDRRTLVKLLHEWERMEIMGSKLERHWRPTPFPIERLT